ncbi:MAG: signal peptidase I [Pseudomonadota bacterium]
MATKSADTEAAKKGGFSDTLKTIVYAFLIALVVRLVAIEPFNIPSKSMLPGLLVGDYLFVSKYSYGYSRHSFSIFGYSLPFSLRGATGRILNSSPKRGDVAVFKLPSDTSKDYIKRIVGLPGDRIQVKGGILHINGMPVKRRKAAEYRYVEGFLFINGEAASRKQLAGFLDTFTGPTSIPTEVTEYIETFANGNEHRIFEERDNDPRSDDTRVYTVPPGHYFGMGDNRDGSEDSRFAVGFIPAENLVGRAEFRFFSTNLHASIWEVWKWPASIRFGRLFTGVK